MLNKKVTQMNSFRECLIMYVNGMGLRAIARVKKVHHTTIINWVKKVGELLPDAYDPETIPEVGELDEERNVCGFKKNNSVDMDCCKSL